MPVYSYKMHEPKNKRYKKIGKRHSFVTLPEFVIRYQEISITKDNNDIK